MMIKLELNFDFFYQSKIAKICLELDFALRDQLCPDTLQNALRLAVGEVVSIVVSGRDFDQPIDLEYE